VKALVLQKVCCLQDAIVLPVGSEITCLASGTAALSGWRFNHEHQTSLFELSQNSDTVGTMSSEDCHFQQGLRLTSLFQRSGMFAATPPEDCIWNIKCKKCVQIVSRRATLSVKQQANTRFLIDPVTLKECD
jgi:hypothetical protein